jgi:hypothetical protein
MKCKQCPTFNILCGLVPSSVCLPENSKGDTGRDEKLQYAVETPYWHSAFFVANSVMQETASVPQHIRMRC